MELLTLWNNRKLDKISKAKTKQCRMGISHPILQVFMFELLCLLVLLVLSLLSLPASGPDLNSLFDTHADSRIVTLLIWWPPFGNKLRIPNCKLNYGLQGCVVTANRSAYKRADAVIMHHRELMTKWNELPQLPRPPRQKWIWMNFESPSHSAFLYNLNGMFNLTMSYRFGSDIYLPYGYLQSRQDHSNIAIHSNPSRKLVAWVISNWNEEQERVQFYQQLRRYVHVDLYGRHFQPLLNNSVVQTVSRYKFYLAFENSCHTDYITEKLWRNALMAGAVPIVLGPPRQNYERFLPADAFIHVEDFKEPRALANYIKHLGRNPNLYLRYMKWRRYYDVQVASFWAEHFCAACQAVKSSQYVNKTVTHLEFWFQSSMDY